MSGDEIMPNKPQHDSDNPLFTPYFIDSMHDISAEEVVEIGVQVITKCVQTYELKKEFEKFDVNKAPYNGN